MSTYTYSLTTDFTSLTEAIDLSQLQAALSFIWFPTNASSIGQDGDSITITFTTALSTNDITTLLTDIHNYTNIYLSYVIGDQQDNQVVIYQQTATGVNAGSSVSGQWVTRSLNIVDGNVSSWIVLNNDNTFTLQPGKYLLTAFIPAYQVGCHQARLFNATLNTVQNVGTSAYNSQLSEIHSLWINNRPDNFRIEHYCSVTVSDVGLGIATNVSANEIYSIIRIDKLY